LFVVRNENKLMSAKLPIKASTHSPGGDVFGIWMGTGEDDGARDGLARWSASIAGSMPKMKTHSGAKKRFRKTATGKLRGRRAYSSHILEKKSPKRKRRMARPVEIKRQDTERVNTLLGGKGGGR
jgi:large subunit ribosomal protein L35